MEKIVKTGLRDCTVNLDGTECAVRFDGCFRVFAVRNDSAGDVYISKTAGIVPDADGVMSVKAGASTVYAHMDMYADTVYLLGKGKVQLHAQNDVINPFNYAPAMDGGEERGESSYTIENAVDYPLMGLTMYGKSVQDGTPTPENPVDIVSVGDSGSVSVQACGKNLLQVSLTTITKNGVTFTVNSDRSVTVNGTASENALFIVNGNEIMREAMLNKIIKLTGCPAGGGASYKLQLWNYDGNGDMRFDNGNGVSFLFTNKSAGFNFAICIFKGYTVNNLVFKPMVQIADVPEDTYEPYHGATANITSALPLCGIPVESGGNYTDKNGQQWAVDYVDFKKGIVVRNCRRVSFNGSEDWIVNSSASHSAGTDNRQRYRLALPEELKALYDPNKYTADTPSRIICNKYPTVPSSQTWFNQTGIATSLTAGYIAVYDEERSTSISEWKTWLSANPMIIVYQLNVPVEIPLSESELQAYRQLQTYNGVTNISNDGGAEMSVGYCTNKMLSEYVMPITTALQKQIDELKSAVLSLGGNI